MPKVRNGSRLDRAAIAAAGLRLLDEAGLDGLTMRAVAAALDVQAPALYWHIRNKQELLDAMAERLFVAVADGVRAPAEGVDWMQWSADVVRRLRRELLRHRDGARVLAGTDVSHPAVHGVIELTLHTLTAAGFGTRQAARAFPTLLHYTIGFTIEEQARVGEAYPENPYIPERIAQSIDATRFPLTAATIGDMFDPDTDAAFDEGLQLILTGMAALLPGQRR
ncbi:putative transcriptional regulator, TetR family (tetracyclin resistance) [Actinocatenispora thailandica]|uniref:Putative transcriptional regulator, TetR family (Tetracyclin resistance) n=1 Tax=Actinocatenispora thailandica TaxID=227318 RepID=A0A7R7DTB9_9ACTN|nr:TetR/AcrR family transcriptional regulator C-terminal domain-containing protein [Actinocatenispora thailandica]BCJ37452.1 putative transcriptional regulator, TetR family (tetracyclin resistance) [Actinocatenispora thailandica]